MPPIEEEKPNILTRNGIQLLIWRKTVRRLFSGSREIIKTIVTSAEQEEIEGS